MWYTFSQQKRKDKSYIVNKIPAADIGAQLALGSFMQVREADKYRRLIQAIVDIIAQKYGPDNINEIFNNLDKYRQEAIFIKAVIEESGIYEIAENEKKSRINISEDIMDYVDKRYPSQKLKMTPAVQAFSKNLMIYDEILEQIEDEILLVKDSLKGEKQFVLKLDELAKKERIINGQKYTLYSLSQKMGITENQLGMMADNSQIITQAFSDALGLEPRQTILQNLSSKLKMSPTFISKMKLNPAQLAKLGTGLSVAELVAMPSVGNINLMKAPWLDTGETKENWFKNHKAEDINEYLEPVLEDYLKQEANRIKLDSSVSASKKLIEFGKLYNKYFNLFGPQKWDQITSVFMQNVPQAKIHQNKPTSQPDLYSALSKTPFGKK